MRDGKVNKMIKIKIALKNNRTSPLTKIKDKIIATKQKSKINSKYFLAVLSSSEASFAISRPAG